MSDKSKKSDTHYAIGNKNPNLPFHPAVRAGDFIFVSGQVAKDENNNMISGTIEEETLATLKTIERVIAHEGATLSDVVRITTYLEDTRDFGRYNRAFLEGIGDAVLARTTVEARAVISTKIEMDAIVYKPLSKKS
ncbi:Rid family hydrolase [Oricola nitratireducens]|uniref:Rid family hydrolase n=1 Tax=Oricola nitratireducens TaxID=2775868 RepID=UPI0018677D72